MYRKTLDINIFYRKKKKKHSLRCRSLTRPWWWGIGIWARWPPACRWSSTRNCRRSCPRRRSPRPRSARRCSAWSPARPSAETRKKRENDAPSVGTRRHNGTGRRSRPFDRAEGASRRNGAKGPRLKIKCRAPLGGPHTSTSFLTRHRHGRRVRSRWAAETSREDLVWIQFSRSRERGHARRSWRRYDARGVERGTGGLFGGFLFVYFFFYFRTNTGERRDNQLRGFPGVQKRIRSGRQRRDAAGPVVKLRRAVNNFGNRFSKYTLYDVARC